MQTNDLSVSLLCMTAPEVENSQTIFDKQNEILFTRLFQDICTINYQGSIHYTLNKVCLFLQTKYVYGINGKTEVFSLQNPFLFITHCLSFSKSILVNISMKNIRSFFVI